MEIKFPVNNNTLYWADMYLWQTEKWLHNAKYDKNKENCLRVAEMWKNKVIKILEEGWKPNPMFVYGVEGQKPRYKVDLTHFGLHKFPIIKYKSTSHKRKPKELREQPQCQCKHFNYEHNKGLCTKCKCEEFRT